MKHIPVSLLLAVLSMNAFSQDCTWKGTEDSLWQNPLNWSCNKVPDANTDVYIFGGTTYSPVITGSVTCKNIFLIDSIEKYLDQAYDALAGDQGYGKVLSLYFTIDNDEMMCITGGANDNSRRSLARYDANPTNNELLKPFRQLYFGIEKCNQCIKYFSLMLANNSGNDIKTQRNRRMYGEALILRSQFYFELIRNWGDVPVSDSTSFIIGDAKLLNQHPFADLKNTNRDSTYNKILNDILLAETYLPWRTELAMLNDTLDERITKAAAKALRARVALFAGGYSLRSDSTIKRPVTYLSFYEITKQECQDLMNHREQHTLNPDYKALWKNTICAHKVENDYGEIIFQAKMAGGGPLSDSKLGYYDGPKVNNFGNASLGLLPTYFYLFDSIDTRRDVVAAPYDVTADNVTKKGVRLFEIRDGKFRRDWINNPSTSPTDAVQYFGLNWPLIRFSDVLLMFAEAENELNGSPTNEAINAFEEVRKRGYGNNANLIGVTPSDKSSFFNAIVKERALEFGGEGIRKYDLIRWNLLESKIAETRTNLTNLVNHEIPYYGIPLFMYYINGATEDNSGIWANSLYYPSPTGSTSIPGAIRVSWTDTSGVSSIVTNNLQYFASNFVSNKCELFPYPIDVITSNPDMIQNPGY